jgi:methyl-accepting chemotaxis protein
MNFVKQLPLGWKLASGALMATAVVLAASLGFVSVRLWHDSHDRGNETLQAAARAASNLVSAYDESARRNAMRDFRMFKTGFTGAFALNEAPGADGKVQPVLSHAGQPLNGKFEQVDAYTAATGAVATVFARSGDDFLRVTTSLRKEDGSRAFGTLLGKAHPAYRDLVDGKTYVGRATLFGKPYMTQYEPIREGGRTIGILFIGSDMTDVLVLLRKGLKEQKLFHTGAVFAVDLREGPALGNVFGFDAPRKLDEKDPDAAAFLKTLRTGGPAGLTEPDWSTVGMKKIPAESVNVAYELAPAWNWMLVAEAPEAEMLAANRSALTVLWSSVLAALAVLAAALLWMSRRLIGQPLAQLENALSVLASGDLRQPLVARSTDEIGRLTQSMEAFRARLATSLATVRQAADGVATASAQIAAGNNDLSARTEQQASSLEQTAASMEQLGTTVRHNADNAVQANHLAQGASTVAVQGGDVVGQVVETMKGINDSSRRIADIIGVIDGIAFQTNILALNAAVEAARAGEQGRGFAVVASEVRSLAQRSADAAREIKVLIGASVERVDQGTELVGRAGSTMGEVVDAIRKVTHIVGEISSASREQSAGVSQVGEAVTQMDQATQQNAALVEQSAAAAQSLKAQAAQLVDAVAVFKIGADASNAAHLSAGLARA